MTTVHLVRHGEVDNPTGILYGRRPGFHLTELGRAMGEEVGKAFSNGHDVRYVMASPLERAQETALPTSQAFDLPMVIDDRLLEAENNFEGIAVNDNRMILAHPKFYSWYANPLRPSWGEPYTAIVRRMSGVIAHAVQEARGGEAVLFSHQLPIWTMRRFVEQKPLAHDPRRRQCALASVTSLTFADWQLTSLDYWEPAAELVATAADMVPGTSAAAAAKGA